MSILHKEVINVDTWQKTIDLQRTYRNIKQVKVSWLYYTTASANHNIMSIRINELGDVGQITNDDKSNLKYFLSLPLDQGFPVTCVYTNPFPTYDNTFSPSVDVNQLSVTIYIDGLPAVSDITDDNKVSMEIVFYS